MKKLLLFLVTLPLLAADPDPFLYKAMFVRAAPGKLLDVIALYKDRMPVYDSSGDERPFWMRHSQGDQWDLMFLFPMGSWEAYFTTERAARRAKAGAAARVPQPEFARRFYDQVAWHEDLYVEGPPLEAVRKAFEGAGLFHVEIFLALPGKQAELYKEREMENAYLKGIGRGSNLIFTHDQGAAWDLFTIGFYRGLKHYAEIEDIPLARRESAAKAAGFAGADMIGPYLRSLISSHHDTLATAVK